MTITVTVKPRSHETVVEKVGEGAFRVSVTVPPEDGKANDAMIQALADYFDIAPSLIEIKSGHTSRVKRIEIHT